MPSELVLDHASSLEPTLGTGRLICVDGLAGSGKTTLAAALAAASGAPVLHSDELLEGWGGLSGLGVTLERVLRPLAEGQPSTWRRWDWHVSAWAESHPLLPTPLLVIDGVGSGAVEIADLITTLVWVEADRDERLARGLARDGEQMRPHWVRWQHDEAVLHRRARTRERADFVLRT